MSRSAHPAADLFPMMTDEELQALAADIKENGQRQPIVLDADGAVLDGRNRLAACEVAGAEPVFVTAAPGDPVALVVSLNVKRRNLTAGQRAIAAAQAWDLAPKIGGKKGRTPWLAEQFSVSRGYVEQARALVERDPTGAESVKVGARSLKEAYEDLSRREGRDRGQIAERQQLREAHPDLADQVDEEVRSLQEALAEAEARAEEERKRRYAATMNLLDGVRLLEQPAEQRYVEEAASLIDPQIAAQRGEHITSERLRAVVAFAGALADALDAQEAS